MATLVCGVLLVVAAAGAAAASFRPRSPIAFALAVFVLAATEIVVLVEILSLVDGVSRWPLLGAATVALAAAAAWWDRGGRPRPPLPRVGREALATHPIVAVLAAAFAAALVYELVAAVSVPPNNPDSLVYRLSRVAAWYQHGGVHWLEGAHTIRENAFPFNSELLMLWTVALSRGEWATALPQVAAHAALALAVAGLARRLGWGRAAAAFAGLVAGTPSLIVLQASTTQNDLFVAALVATSAYFLYGGTNRDFALAGLAFGVAAGAKTTTFFALPALALIALAALPPRRVVTAAAIAAAATVALGLPPYARSVIHADGPLGGSFEQTRFYADVSVVGTISNLGRMTWRFVDLSGFRGIRTAWLEPVADAGEAFFEVTRIPWYPAESGAYPVTFAVNVIAHEDHSFFGPLGVLLILPLVAAYTAAFALRRTTAPRGVHALALPLGMLGLAIVFRFSDEARYLLPSLALMLPLAAGIYRRRAATPVAAIAIATLAFAHLSSALKPTGIGTRAAVWDLSRSEVQALDLQHRGAAWRAIDRLVPADARLGVVLRHNDPAYPLYGGGLRRRVVPLPPDDPVAAAERVGIRHVFLGRAIRVPARGWRVRHYLNAGRLLTAP